LQATGLVAGAIEAEIDLFDQTGSTFDSSIDVVSQFPNFLPSKADGFQGGGKFLPQGVAEFFGTASRPSDFLKGWQGSN
jgi:hypothetical protein